MAFWKDSMINRLSNLINRNRSAVKISPKNHFFAKNPCTHNKKNVAGSCALNFGAIDLIHS